MIQQVGHSGCANTASRACHKYRGHGEIAVHDARTESGRKGTNLKPVTCSRYL
jgi:hypothetical protein